MSAKSQHNNILLAILGFISVIVLVAVIGYFTLDRTEEIIQGEVEVSEYRVACKLPGRITELRVKEGDYVHKGDVLAVLEIPEVNEQEKVAEAAANATEALSDLAKAPTRKEMIQSAYQVYQQAKSANRIAYKQFIRFLFLEESSRHRNATRHRQLTKLHRRQLRWPNRSGNWQRTDHARSRSGPHRNRHRRHGRPSM